MHGIDGRRAAGQAKSDHRQDHIARSGDVVHRARLRWIYFSPPVGHDQRDAVAIERDDAEIELQIAAQLPGRPDGLFVRSDGDSRGNAGLGAVGSHRRGAVVTRVVAFPNWVDQHRQSDGPCDVYRHAEQSRSADSLAVIGNQQRIVIGDQGGKLARQAGFQILLQRIAHFAVDAQDLMRMAALGLADEAFLDRRGPRGVDQQTLRIDGHIAKQLPHRIAVAVIADDTGVGHFGPQAAEHVAHVARSAQANLAMVDSQHDHRRFLADPIGIAPGIAIENDVSEHQHAGPA